MPMYDDLSDWTDERLTSEYHRIDGYHTKLVQSVDDDSEYSVLQRTQDKQYSAKLQELEDEVERRKSHKRKRQGGMPKAGRPRRGAKKEPRLASLLGPFAPVPRAIGKPALSLAAKGLAFTIADDLNLGPWNTDLHVDTSYPRLVEKTGASRSTLQRLMRELEDGYVKTENRQRGGIRVRFIASPVTTT